MKFLCFITLITLSNFGYSYGSGSHSEVHKKEQKSSALSDDSGEHNSRNGHQHDAKASTVIKNAMIKTTPPGITNSAAYLTILNNSSEDITLIDVASDAAQLVEMHEHIIFNGTMKMQRMGPLKIEANSSVQFKPGGYHIMFINVAQEIKDGDTIDVTLTFDDGSNKTITTAAKKQYAVESNTHQHN